MTELAPAAPAERTVSIAGVRMVLVSRDEFLTERWYYEPGQHVTVLGPNGTGKSTLVFQLMQHTTSPALPGVILVMKPHKKASTGQSGDITVTRWSAGLGYRTVRTWPPKPAMPGTKKPNGWTLWPRHSFEPDRDNAMLRFEFRKAILDSYKHGDRVLFVDEVYGVAEELSLDRELVAVWSRGRSMGCGLWAASQRPVNVPLWAYSEAHHLFLHNTPEERARKRYDEIGGVDARLVKDVVAQLPKFHWLYIRRAGPELCIVEA